jgi:methyl-accepting chemotaxis protein
VENSGMSNTKEMIDNLTDILNGLDSSQEQLEKNAFDVINSSDTSLNLVKESIGSVKEILEMIDSLNAVVSESSAKIKELKSLSGKIEEFAEVISNISNKTNILSLNASIEAARAGEHGRGFAVVASEVRNLASRSAKSSKEITDTIAQVQLSVSETVDAMTTVYNNAVAQKEKADEVEQVLHKVVDAAYTANEVARNIENEIAYQREITDKARNALSVQ